MKTPVTFNVYLQALGGKFLGPNAYNNAGISLQLKYSMGTVPLSYNVAAKGLDDGNISTSFTDGSSSFLPILTMPVSANQVPTVNYLTPGATTIIGTTKIFLPNSNEIAMLSISIPTPSGQPLLIDQPVLLNPQQINYTITVVVPGLLLTPNTSIIMSPGTISVFVAMMCGCKITVGTTKSFWTYTDFTVSAMVTYKDGTGARPNLSFDQTTNTSLFTAAVANYGNISQVNFAAQQKSTGNYGLLLQQF